MTVHSRHSLCPSVQVGNRPTGAVWVLVAIPAGCDIGYAPTCWSGLVEADQHQYLLGAAKGNEVEPLQIVEGPLFATTLGNSFKAREWSQKILEIMT